MVSLFHIQYFGPLLVFLTAVFLIRECVAYKKILFLKYMFTPLITAGVIAFVVLSMMNYGVNTYSVLILTGLVLALIADGLLMIEEVNLLKNGIIFFLLTHVVYIAAFSRGYTFVVWKIIIAVILVSALIGMLVAIKDRLGDYLVPVIIYAVAISIMAFFAWGRLGASISRHTFFIALGATLFVVSDLLLAINAFIKPIPHSTVFTWSLYAPAQFLIALSCFR